MYHLAQVNIAKPIAPKDSPILADFVNNLNRINTVADRSEGFVWRLQGEEADAHASAVFKDKNVIVNISVWKDIESLFNFTYKSEHVDIFSRRKEWFSKLESMHMVFWYIPKNHTPTPEEAKARLHYYNTHGESPYAFSFKRKHTPEEAQNYTPVT